MIYNECLREKNCYSMARGNTYQTNSKITEKHWCRRLNWMTKDEIKIIIAEGREREERKKQDNYLKYLFWRFMEKYIYSAILEMCSIFYKWVLIILGCTYILNNINPHIRIRIIFFMIFQNIYKYSRIVNFHSEKLKKYIYST